jgi:hypothetical protein
MINLNPFSLATNRLISESSDSSDLSYQFKADQIKFFPTSPRNPDKILESMIKHFRIHKTIPASFLTDLPLETCKIIVEKLLQERQAYQEENFLKHEESADEEKEYERPSLARQGSSGQLKKLQAFRAIENVSPIEKDDSERYTNYNINSLALTPHEETVVNLISVKVKKYEDYKREILKLANELKELTSYNQALSLIISLDKENELDQLKQQVSEKINLLDKFSAKVSENLRNLKKTIEPNEGFLEHLPMHRQELKILTEMIGFDRKLTCKPSEMQIINKVMDCCIEDPDNLEKFIDNLLAGHDVAEISLMLVKYIKYLEDQSSVALKSEALNCLITEIRNDLALEENLNQSLALFKDIQTLKAQKNRLEYEQKKRNRKEQVRIRESPQRTEKNKWKLPQSMENLTGAELYSKALAVIKKK